METKINNAWLTMSEQRNEVDVQRAFAGLNVRVQEPDEDTKSIVDLCLISYWERELYPNGEQIKVQMKSYSLQDLSETIDDENGWKQEALLVLTGFVKSLGYNGIINPTRSTLSNIEILPLNAEDNYPLHRDTRVKTNI
jgi:hypothetical protein